MLMSQQDVKRYDIRRVGLPSTRRAFGILWKSRTPLWQPRFNKFVRGEGSEGGLPISVIFSMWYKYILWSHISAGRLLHFVHICRRLNGGNDSEHDAQHETQVTFHLHCTTILVQLGSCKNLGFGLSFSSLSMKSTPNIIASGCDPDRANISLGYIWRKDTHLLFLK